MTTTVPLGMPSSYQPVKFYQTGSFVVGNRLLDEDQRSVQADPDRRTNALTSGHRACQGCGEALGARYALDAANDAADGKVITVNATGCLEVFSTPYPETSWRVPWPHSLFGNAPAVATGVQAALRALGRDDERVVAQGGDGGTVDIGFACLSGMFERNDDVLYICYDNEAYMNTGVQRSGATPPGARTATTQAVGPQPGNIFGQGKDVPRIAMAHEIPYVATATVADLRDLEAKVAKAMTMRGARYIHVFVPCPLGWGSASSHTVRIARLAAESGLFPVFEAERGEVTGVKKIRRQVPVEEYLRLQRRYAHLFKPRRDDILDRLQAAADRNIRRYGLVDAEPETDAAEHVRVTEEPSTGVPVHTGAAPHLEYPLPAADDHAPTGTTALRDMHERPDEVRGPSGARREQARDSQAGVWGGQDAPAQAGLAGDHGETNGPDAAEGRRKASPVVPDAGSMDVRGEGLAVDPDEAATEPETDAQQTTAQEENR